MGRTGVGQDLTPRAPATSAQGWQGDAQPRQLGAGVGCAWWVPGYSFKPAVCIFVRLGSARIPRKGRWEPGDF